MDDFLRPISYDEVYYDRNGSICVDDTGSVHALAKEVTKTSDQISTLSYHILFKINTMVDPWGEDSGLRRLRDCRFKKVTKDSFEAYIKYLKTKQRRFLTIAERNTYV
jgi:hypothetical protein